MKATDSLTFEEGCNKYLEYCRQRNLRQGTINHYKQSYTQFYKFFDPKTPIEEIDENAYKRYVLHLKSTLNNDISINSYLRDFITTMHFLMNEGYVPCFKMNSIKVDKNHIETYTENELKLLLKKPNIHMLFLLRPEHKWSAFSPQTEWHDPRTSSDPYDLLLHLDWYILPRSIVKFVWMGHSPFRAASHIGLKCLWT